MDEVAFLSIMALMLILASIASILFRKLRLPAIIGYLAAGIIITNVWGVPDGISETVIKLLSSIGLVLLMFAIGMELNIKRLKQSGGFTIMVAAIQLPLVVLSGYIAGSLIGLNTVESLFLGAIISGSSTAVCTIVLRANKTISKDTADTIILVTVMDDIGQVIILTLLSPLLVGDTPTATGMVWLMIGIVVFMVAAIVLGLLVVPRFLDWVSDKFDREILLITALGMCFGLALLSTYVGLSMAIGAFLMGLIASQCKDADLIERDVEPMKNTFMAIFFIDVGMQVHLAELGSSLMMAMYIYVVFLVSKIISVSIAYVIGNKDLKTTFVSAVSLLVMGEFAFIIAKTALDAGAVTPEFYTAVVFSALTSMILLPLFAGKSVAGYEFLKRHTPKPVVSGIERLEIARSDFYSRIVFSTRSVKRVKNRATVVYAGIFAIIVIEILFYLYGGLLSSAVETYFMLSEHIATNITFLINLGILIVPTSAIVVSLKVIDRMLIEGGKRKRGYHVEEEEEPETDSTHSKFIGISNILLVLLIDFLILLIVPSPLPIMDYLKMITGGLILVVIGFIYKSVRK